ncbi:MAG: DUF4158 domain-containing protein, partial [Candidatus Tectomicrobia bacterium]
MNEQSIHPSQRRLRILGREEIDALYGRPDFTHDERLEYFALSQPEKEVLQELRTVKSQVYFILQLGYFKAKHLFFPFDFDDVLEDTESIL